MIVAKNSNSSIVEKTIESLRVVIVHDYLRSYGGGERVVSALLEMFPNAKLIVASVDKKRFKYFSSVILNRKVETTWVQRFPLLINKPALCKPFLPLVWSSVGTIDADVVISSSGSNMAKGVVVNKHAVHICYCHTPPRFLYGYKTESRLLNNTIVRLLLAPLTWFLILYDLSTNKSVDYFLANSQNVARRIKKHYGLKAAVVYPPNSFPTIGSSVKKKKNFLVVSRLESNKNIDLIIKAFNKNGLRLVIVGEGKQAEKLKRMAGKTINFLGEVEDGRLVKLYQQAEALVVAAADEDFGISTVESMSQGTPVIAIRQGGFIETVVEGKTGVFFDSLNPEAINEAVDRFNNYNFNQFDCVRQAEMFSKKNFQRQILQTINLLLVKT